MLNPNKQAYEARQNVYHQLELLWPHHRHLADLIDRLGPVYGGSALGAVMQEDPRLFGPFRVDRQLLLDMFLTHGHNAHTLESLIANLSLAYPNTPRVICGNGALSRNERVSRVRHIILTEPTLLWVHPSRSDAVLRQYMVKHGIDEAAQHFKRYPSFAGPLRTDKVSFHGSLLNAPAFIRRKAAMVETLRSHGNLQKTDALRA